jgi:hypothetical protein
VARYRIILKNGKQIDADDARSSGAFLEYITRDLHSTQAIPSTDVDHVERAAIGWEGGLRFTGKSDSSFDPTPGSIGGPPTGSS